MSNFGQQNGTDQFSAGEQEFAYGETRKPLNRNLVVLLLIAVVGASLIYLMYVRGRFNADTQTPELVAANQQVADLMKDAPKSISQMEKDLEQTRKAVESFSQSNSSGQVPVDKLRTNPFSIETPRAEVVQTKVKEEKITNPTGDIRTAADKAKVQMILFSATGASTVQINNWIYKEGERIIVDGVPFTVKKITRDSVVLSHPEGDFPLEMQKGL